MKSVLLVRCGADNIDCVVQSKQIARVARKLYDTCISRRNILIMLSRLAFWSHSWTF